MPSSLTGGANASPQRQCRPAASMQTRRRRRQ